MDSNILDEIKLLLEGKRGSGNMHMNNWIAGNICKSKFSSNLVLPFFDFR